MKSMSRREIRTTGLLLLMILAAGCSTGRGNGGDAFNNNRTVDDSRGQDISVTSVRTTERDHGVSWESERNFEGNSHGYPSDTH